MDAGLANLLRFYCLLKAYVQTCNRRSRYSFPLFNISDGNSISSNTRLILTPKPACWACVGYETLQDIQAASPLNTRCPSRDRGRTAIEVAKRQAIGLALTLNFSPLSATNLANYNKAFVKLALAVRCLPTSDPPGSVEDFIDDIAASDVVVVEN